MKPRTSAVLLLGMCLPACHPRSPPQGMVDHAVGIGGLQPRPGVGDDAAAGVVHAVRTHARSHALLGIDFARPLHLPKCARYYDTFDRPDRTCMYVNDRGQPFKIEFRAGAVPDFVKWPNAAIATDTRGFVQRMHVDVSTDPKLQGKAVDAMLEMFGPPTRITSNSGPKIGLWEHDDYVIQQILDPEGPFVQMDTRKAHDAEFAQSPAPMTHLH